MRAFRAAFLLGLALGWAGAAPAEPDGEAASEELEELLGGFDDEEPTADDDLLGGFDDDEPAADDDLLGGFDDDEPAAADDLLGGFDDDEPAADDDLLGGFDDDEGASRSARRPRRNPLRGEHYTITGSVSTETHVNLIDHSVGPFGRDGDPPEATSYSDFSRFRTRINLQLDLDLPFDWQLRAAGFGWWDWFYMIRGQDQFTPEVLRQYQGDSDTLDFWVRGRLFDRLDVKIGRQVVNWGRSESLRVLDVLNPLDSRVPGIADIEDLRRAVSMARFDTSFRNWDLTVVAIPEIRRPQLPVIGSDFFPPLPPGAESIEIVTERPASWENWETGVHLRGIFQGWDVSFQFAYFFDDFAVLEDTDITDLPLQLVYSRLWQLGTGANYTIGSWLVKGEFAYTDGLIFTDQPDTKSRLDLLVGVEYFGFRDTTIALEALYSYTLDFPAVPSAGQLGAIPLEHDVQGALRISRTFLRERLDTNFLALLVRGFEDVGGIFRVDASYDLRDALVLSTGFVFYLPGDRPPLDAYGENHRWFVELRYSF